MQYNGILSMRMNILQDCVNDRRTSNIKRR